MRALQDSVSNALTGGPVPLMTPDAAHSQLLEVGERISVAATLLESSRVMTELLRLVSPALYTRTLRITHVVTRAVRAMDLDQPWEFEVAARLSQIGCLALPPAMREAGPQIGDMTEEDERTLASHPLIARDLLGEVQRLGAVREMIARQREPYTVIDAPFGGAPDADRVALGGQLLKAASDYADLTGRGMSPSDAMARLEACTGEYNVRVLQALSDAVCDTEPAAA